MIIPLVSFELWLNWNVMQMCGLVHCHAPQCAKQGLPPQPLCRVTTGSCSRPTTMALWHGKTEHLWEQKFLWIFADVDVLGGHHVTPAGPTVAMSDWLLAIQHLGLTAHEMTEWTRSVNSMEHCMSSGATRFLSKPINFDQLIKFWFFDQQLIKFAFLIQFWSIDQLMKIDRFWVNLTVLMQQFHLLKCEIWLILTHLIQIDQLTQNWSINSNWFKIDQLIQNWTFDQILMKIRAIVSLPRVPLKLTHETKGKEVIKWGFH